MGSAGRLLAETDASPPLIWRATGGVIAGWNIRNI
jgi:hypothetical protein